MDGFFLNPNLTQAIRQFVAVAAGEKIGRRALQHRHMLNIISDGRDNRSGGSARANHNSALALHIGIIGPKLRVDDLPLKIRHARPIGRVGISMAVIALAHPQEIGGELLRFAAGRVCGGHRPAFVSA